MSSPQATVLVSLSISKWNGKKIDNAASRELNERKEASADASRVTVQLVSPETFAALTALESQIRAFHYSKTLTAHEDGLRFLPVRNVEEYLAAMAAFRSQWSEAVDAFCVAYEGQSTEQSARARLGKLYHATDFPDVAQVKGKFAIAVNVYPAPSPNQLVAHLPEDIADAMRASIAESVREAEARANEEIYSRVTESLAKLHTALADPNKKFRDSLFQNVREAVAAIPGLNFTDDPDLEVIGSAVESNVLTTTPEEARNDQEKRAKVSEKAKQLLDGIRRRRAEMAAAAAAEKAPAAPAETPAAPFGEV